MGLSDTVKNLRKKAEETAVEHKDQIHDAVQKAGEAADRSTKGKYHDKIVKAGDAAQGYVDKLAPIDEPKEPAGEDSPPPAPAGERPDGGAGAERGDGDAR
jgi:hypothetical protein